MRVRTAPYVARAHASRPPQSRHISCAAKPLSAEKLPLTACGTRAHQEGKTSPCTQAGLCYRTALLMCMGMFPLVGRACVGVCVGAGVLCDHSGAARQASNAASPAPTQTPTPSRRTYAASPPPDTQTCAHSSCVARAHTCVSDGSKVEHFLCGKAAYVRKNLYICSMKFIKIFLTICRAVVGFLIDNKYCLWCITHRKKWW